jgi:hypothetical protein
MSIVEFLGVLCARYREESDTFIVSIGHSDRPFPHRPISLTNLPEILADTSITVGDIRRWFEEVRSEAAR